MARLSLPPPAFSAADAGGSHGLLSAARIRRRTFVGNLVALAALPWSSRVGSEQDSAPERLAEPHLQEFARGDLAYEIKRQSTVWQALKPDRRPALIVAAQSDQDVIQALQQARAEERQVSVCAGGHSYIAGFLRDDTVLIDVSAMLEIHVSRDRRSLTVGPGVRAAVLDAYLAQHDLAFPVPHVGSVGMGGFLLGGGMGWNGETWNGMACFNTRAVDLITADGRQLTVAADSHPHLFAAACGAGPAFCAVATRFHLTAFSRPQAVVRSTYVFRLASVASVAKWLQQTAAAAHSGMELTMILARDEEGAAADTPRSASCLASVTCCADSRAQANASLDQVARMAPAAPSAIDADRRELTFAELLAANYTGTPRRLAADNIWTQRPVEALTMLAGHFVAAPSANTVVIANFRSAEGPRRNATCSVMAPCYLMWLASWDQAADDVKNLEWVDAAARLVDPYAAGCYINETDFLSRPERARRSFTADDWRRLHTVKTEYDPRNLFYAPF